MGIPKVAYVCVVLNICLRIICRRTSGGPLTYIHIRNRSIHSLTLAYVHSKGFGLGFKENLGVVRLQLWAWVLVKTKFC
jgi:hypothetical protein